MTNEWLEALHAMKDTEQPFRSLKKENHFLKALHLSPSSTAEDVRRAAITLRLKFENYGISAETFSALRWSLERTRDAQTDEEFLRFMLNPNARLEEIEADRMDFR